MNCPFDCTYCILQGYVNLPATGIFVNTEDLLHATTTGMLYAGTGWHHVVYVIDASNNSQNVYIDGVVMGSTVHTQSLSYVGLGSNTFIGKHGNGVGTYDFNGLIDDVSVYNRALSNQEVQNLYNIGINP